MEFRATLLEWCSRCKLGDCPTQGDTLRLDTPINVLEMMKQFRDSQEDEESGQLSQDGAVEQTAGSPRGVPAGIPKPKHEDDPDSSSNRSTPTKQLPKKKPSTLTCSDVLKKNGPSGKGGPSSPSAGGVGGGARVLGQGSSKRGSPHERCEAGPSAGGSPTCRPSPCSGKVDTHKSLLPSNGGQGQHSPKNISRVKAKKTA